MDRGIPGDGEEEKGPCRETGARCARDVERERLAREMSPDALDALSLFRAARGQWRTGFSGAVALDYGLLFSERFSEVVGVPLTRPVFGFVKVAEEEALAIFKEWNDAAKDGNED